MKDKRVHQNVEQIQGSKAKLTNTPDLLFSDEKITNSEEPQSKTVFIKNSSEEFTRFGVRNVPKEFLTHLSQQKRPSKATNAFANVEENGLLESNSGF